MRKYRLPFILRVFCCATTLTHVLAASGLYLNVQNEALASGKGSMKGSMKGSVDSEDETSSESDSRHKSKHKSKRHASDSSEDESSTESSELDSEDQFETTLEDAALENLFQPAAIHPKSTFYHSDAILRSIQNARPKTEGKFRRGQITAAQHRAKNEKYSQAEALAQAIGFQPPVETAEWPAYYQDINASYFQYLEAKEREIEASSHAQKDRKKVGVQKLKTAVQHYGKSLEGYTPPGKAANSQTLEKDLQIAHSYINLANTFTQTIDPAKQRKRHRAAQHWGVQLADYTRSLEAHHAAARALEDAQKNRSVTPDLIQNVNSTKKLVEDAFAEVRSAHKKLVAASDEKNRPNESNESFGAESRPAHPVIESSGKNEAVEKIKSPKKNEKTQPIVINNNNNINIYPGSSGGSWTHSGPVGLSPGIAVEEGKNPSKGTSDPVPKSREAGSVSTGAEHGSTRTLVTFDARPKNRPEPVPNNLILKPAAPAVVPAVTGPSLIHAARGVFRAIAEMAEKIPDPRAEKANEKLERYIKAELPNGKVLQIPEEEFFKSDYRHAPGAKYFQRNEKGEDVAISILDPKLGDQSKSEPEKAANKKASPDRKPQPVEKSQSTARLPLDQKKRNALGGWGAIKVEEILHQVNRASVGEIIRGRDGDCNIEIMIAANSSGNAGERSAAPGFDTVGQLLSELNSKGRAHVQETCVKGNNRTLKILFVPGSTGTNGTSSSEGK